MLCHLAKSLLNCTLTSTLKQPTTWIHGLSVNGLECSLVAKTQTSRDSLNNSCLHLTLTTAYNKSLVLESQQCSASIPTISVTSTIYCHIVTSPLKSLTAHTKTSTKTPKQECLQSPCFATTSTLPLQLQQAPSISMQTLIWQTMSTCHLATSALHH